MFQGAAIPELVAPNFEIATAAYIRPTYHVRSSGSALTTSLADVPVGFQKDRCPPRAAVFLSFGAIEG